MRARNSVLALAAALVASPCVAMQQVEVPPKATLTPLDNVARPKVSEVHELAEQQQFFSFNSTNIVEEVKFLSDLLRLEPGMTVCEMGLGEGDLLAGMANHVHGLKLVGTTADDNSDAVRLKFHKLGLQLNLYLAVYESFAPGLPQSSCDVLLSRKVYHMLPAECQRTYPRQWASALKPNGLMVHIDFNALGNSSDVITSGPHVPISNSSDMDVVPQETEMHEITSNGPFKVVFGPMRYPFVSPLLSYVVGYQLAQPEAAYTASLDRTNEAR